jgi:hypothetical protein
VKIRRNSRVLAARAETGVFLSPFGKLHGTVGDGQPQMAVVVGTAGGGSDVMVAIFVGGDEMLTHAEGWLICCGFLLLWLLLLLLCCRFDVFTLMERVGSWKDSMEGGWRVDG